MCDLVDSGVLNNNGYLYFFKVQPLHLGLCCLDTPPYVYSMTPEIFSETDGRDSKH